MVVTEDMVVADCWCQCVNLYLLAFHPLYRTELGDVCFDDDAAVADSAPGIDLAWLWN